ncbi:MAG: lactate utilization protein, partial [Bacillota bacterium]
MEAIKEYNRVCAEIIIENFAKRNIEGFFCPTAEDAVQKALDLIKKGSTVSWGGSMTLQEIGLLDKLKDYDYNLLDRSTAESDDEKIKIYHDALSADYYLMSSNAITQDGKLVNIDGN